MTRCAVLLRGTNIGPNNRIPMADLRALLTGAGFTGVATYLQSGNVALTAGAPAEAVARRCQALIAQRFGLDIPCAVRTREELEAVVGADPLAGVVTDPRLYQVSFLPAAPDPEVLLRLAAAATPDERFALIGHEIYAWHPGGIARSRLATLLAGRALNGTARNWTTVTTLLAMLTG